jgi:hypothetical protein
MLKIFKFYTTLNLTLAMLLYNGLAFGSYYNKNPIIQSNQSNIKFDSVEKKSLEFAKYNKDKIQNNHLKQVQISNANGYNGLHQKLQSIKGYTSKNNDLKNKFYAKGVRSKRSFMNINITSALSSYSNKISLNDASWNVTDSSGNTLSNNISKISPVFGVQARFFPMSQALIKTKGGISFFKPFFAIDFYASLPSKMKLQKTIRQTLSNKTQDATYSIDVELNNGTSLFLGAGLNLINNFYILGAYDVLYGKTRIETGYKFPVFNLYKHQVTIFAAMDSGKNNLKTEQKINNIGVNGNIAYKAFSFGAAFEIF